MRKLSAAGGLDEGQGALALLWEGSLEARGATAAAPAQAVAAGAALQPIDVIPPVASAKPGDHQTGYGVGSTVRTAAPVITTVPATSAFSNQDINGILAGSAWGRGQGRRR